MPETDREAADNLTNSLNGLKDELAKSAITNKRNSFLIKLLAALFATFAAVIIVLGAFGEQSHNAAQDAKHAAQLAQQANIAACTALAKSNASNLKLWMYILDAAAKSPMNQTPQAAQQLVTFRGLVTSEFAPPHC